MASSFSPVRGDNQSSGAGSEKKGVGGSIMERESSPSLVREKKLEEGLQQDMSPLKNGGSRPEESRAVETTAVGPLATTSTSALTSSTQSITTSATASSTTVPPSAVVTLSDPSNQQQQQQQQEPNIKDTKKNPKLQKIYSLLTHRRLLLQRVQQCQKASQERLKVYASSAAAATKESNVNASSTTAATATTAALDAKGGNSSSPLPPATAAITVPKNYRTPRLFASQQSEVQHYQSLCAHALQYTNKRPSSTTHDKSATAASSATATTLPPRPSLRKGASVGKKMQAAVASLTSGGGAAAGWGAASDGGNTSNAVVVVGNKPATTTKAEPQRTALGSSSSPLAPGVVLPLTSSSSLAVPIASINPTVIPPPSMMSMSTSTHPIATEAAAPVAPVPKGKVLKRKSSKVKRQSSKKSNAMSSSSDLAPTANRPLHAGMGDMDYLSAWGTPPIPPSSAGEYWSSHYSNVPPPPHHFSQSMGGSIPSRSLCPELQVLRNRKKELLDRLEQLQQEGRDTGSVLEKESVSAQSRSDVYMEKGTNSCFLPERRKTQWDYVLEEMRWLSTDFVEERKWKVASARAISTAVSSQAASKRRSPKRKQGLRSPPPSSDREKPPPPSQPMDGSSQVEAGKEARPIVTEQLESMGTQDSSCAVITPEAEIDIKTYEDPTEEEVEQCRRVSTLLSTVVQAQWDSIAKDGDSLRSQSKVAFSSLRFLRSMSGTKGNISNKEEPMNVLDEVMTDDLDSLQRQLSYDEILRHLLSILEAVSKTKSNLKNVENENGNEFNFEPCNSQRKGIQFVESLWSNESNLSSGVVLKGSYGCGKTVLTALIARRRLNAGPQLVLCSSASVVSWPRKMDLFNMSIFSLNLL